MNNCIIWQSLPSTRKEIIIDGGENCEDDKETYFIHCKQFVNIR